LLKNKREMLMKGLMHATDGGTPFAGITLTRFYGYHLRFWHNAQKHPGNLPALQQA